MNILSDTEDDYSENEIDFENEYFDYIGYFNDIGVELNGVTELNDNDLEKSLKNLKQFYTNTVASILKLYQGSNNPPKTDHWSCYSSAVENLSEMFKYSKDAQMKVSKSSYNEGKSKFQYNLIQKATGRHWNNRLSQSCLRASLCVTDDDMARLQRAHSSSQQKRRLRRKRHLQHSGSHELSRGSSKRMRTSGHQGTAIAVTAAIGHSPSRSTESSDDDDIEDRLDREIRQRRCRSANWRT